MGAASACSGPEAATDPNARGGVQGGGSNGPAPPTTTVIPEGAYMPAVHVAWSGTPATPVAATGGTIPALVINQTKSPVTGSLTLVASGLDGRLVQSSLGTFNVAANGTLTVTVPVSALPIQSQTSSSFVALQAEIARPDGTMLRPSSAPLYYHFDSGYQSATFYSAEDMLSKYGGGAIGSAGASPLGRIKGADGQWQDVLPGAVGPSVATLVPAARVQEIERTMAASTDQPDSTDPTLIPSLQGLAANVSVTICTTWRVQYIDGGFGEDALATSAWQDAPARYAYYEIWQGSTLFWQGFLNSTACVTTAMPTGALQFRQYTTNTREFAGPNPNYINSYVSDSAGNVTSLYVASNYTVTGPTTFNFHPTTNVPAIQVAAVAAQILYSNSITSQGLGMKGYTLNARAPFGCPGVVPATDSCYDPNVDWTNIGTTVIGSTNAHDYQWKYIIAHELGHNIQARNWGQIYLNYTDNASTEPLCRCDHYTTAWANQEHCMNSREYMGGGEMEGYAHASATRTFNYDDSVGSAKFVYYKPFLGFFDDGEEVELPPLAFNLSSSFRPKWLVNECPAGLNHEGNEYDWVTFYYAISVATIVNPTTFNDLTSIYRRACSGGTGLCTGQDLTWSQLTSAALGYYGGSATNPKYVRFRDTGSSAGVNL